MTFVIKTPRRGLVTMYIHGGGSMQTIFECHGSWLNTRKPYGQYVGFYPTCIRVVIWNNPGIGEAFLGSP